MKTKLFLLSCCFCIVSALTFSTNANAQCQAGFTYTVSGGTVTFTNTSTSQQTPNYTWNFGDNSTFWGNSGSHSYTNPGVYYVCLTLDDTINLCTSTFCDSVHVLVGCYGITASATSVDASSQSACDGSASGSVTGGTAPYAYQWSNAATTTTISNLCVGNYQLMVTDANGCTSTANTLVNCPFVCNDSFGYWVNGLSAVFYNMSNDTMSSIFSWNFGDNTFSNAINPGSHAYASAGTYTVTCVMSSNFLGCSDSMSAPVTVGGPTSCSAGFNMQPDSFTVGLWYIYPSVTGQAPITYLWDFGDTTTSTQQFPTHNYAFACHHVVCLTITDANACSSMYCDSSMTHRSATANYMTSLVAVDLTAGIMETKELKGNTFPNPASEFVNVVFNKNVSGTLRLTTITGQLISEQKIDGQRIQLDIRNLPQGIYSISLSDEKTTWNEKIVIVR